MKHNLSKKAVLVVQSNWNLKHMKYIDFDNIEVSTDWAFDNVRSTEQWTHGYHRYPAKFLPNVVKN